MSALQVFLPGDQVVYAGHGLAKIGGVEEVRAGKCVAQMYALVLVGAREASVKVRVGSPQLRAVASRAEADEALLLFAEKPIKTSSWSRRLRGLSSKLQGGLLGEVAEVVRDLEVRRVTDRLAFSERAVLDRARAFFLSEMALILGLSAEEVAADVDKRVLELVHT